MNHIRFYKRIAYIDIKKQRDRNRVKNMTAGCLKLFRMLNEQFRMAALTIGINFVVHFFQAIHNCYEIFPALSRTIYRTAEADSLKKK